MATPTIRGISFPFRAGPQGFPQPSWDDDLLWESLVQLIQTRRSERVMRPDVGSLAENFVFENNTPLTGELLAADIAQLVARYEPRVVLQAVVPRQGTGDEESHLILDITFINRSSGSVVTRSLALPTPEGS